MDKKNINVLTGKFDLDVKNSLSPLFSLAKIYVMYVGKNPNGSIISKEAVERNIETLRNIPIVGEYIRETNMREAREVDLISMKNSLIDESWGDPIIGFSSKEEALLFKLSWM